MHLKDILKQYLPSLYQFLRKIYIRISLLGSNKKRFTKIYKNNIWGDNESVSGPGSSLIATKKIQSQLPLILNKYNAKSILDIPCGDFNWMSKTLLPVDKYIGADIVEEIVVQNSKKYSSDIVEFVCLDIITDKLPIVDIVLVRECFIHFSDEDISKALKNIHDSGSKYLITTNHFATKENKNILTGDWRPLNLIIKPFAFPEPLHILYEDQYNDKSLCLWEISKLQSYIKKLC